MTRLLLSPCLVLAVLLNAGTARADERPVSFDNVLTESAVVPTEGTKRFVLGGGGVGIENGMARGSFSALWSFKGPFAATASAVYEGGQLSPALAVRWQLLQQEQMGVNLTTSLRYKVIGFDPKGSELELGAALGRQIGSMLLTGNLVLGHGFSELEAADVELHSSALWALSQRVTAGLDARYRTEIEPDKIEAQGLAWDVLAGPTVAVALGPVRLQAIAGYSAGRQLRLGVQHPGAFGLATVSADL